MVKKILPVLLVCAVLFPNTLYAADYAFNMGEKHWRVTLSQRALNQLGYKTDRSDGVFTQATANALESFQRKYNLTITKNIDKQTYDKLMTLQKASGTSTSPSSGQVNTASSANVTKPSPAVIAATKNTTPKLKNKANTNSKATTANKSVDKNTADKIITTASKYYGVPYKFGGTTSKGFDCSGYTQVVFRAHGVTLPRSADMQYKLGRPVSKKELRKGDLVFFSTYEPGPSHVGIYDGNGKFWNATTSRGVMASPIDDPHYWGPRYLGARRIL